MNNHAAKRLRKLARDSELPPPWRSYIRVTKTHEIQLFNCGKQLYKVLKSLYKKTKKYPTPQEVTDIINKMK